MRFNPFRRLVEARNARIEAERRELYTKAFKDAYSDLEETNEYDTEERAKELAEERLKVLLSLVDYKNVISLSKTGKIMLGKEEAGAVTLNNLLSEAEFLKGSTIWKLMHETPKELAHNAMFVNSLTPEDVLKGKAMLYVLDSQKNILDLCSSIGRK